MKLVLQILLILIIIATFSICAIQPDLHKNVIIYDSAYTLVSEQEVKTETNKIPIMEKETTPVKTTTTVETVGQALPDKKITQTNTSKKVTTTKTPVTQTKTQTVSKSQKQTATKTAATVQKPVAKKETTVKVEPKKVEKKISTHPAPTLPNQGGSTVVAQKVMTQQEKNIAWNKWRSDLTNKIMQDTKLPDIPAGTIFQFSFNVDKYGKISNVQTGANPANYTPYAIQYIAPVIRSYQGRSILNFPEGTQRTSTQVTGKWRISNSEKYSTPQDYNDVEKVIR